MSDDNYRLRGLKTGLHILPAEPWYHGQGMKKEPARVSTFMCTEGDAQRIYNYLFEKKPKYFEVYKEADPDEHIFITFPMEVDQPLVDVEVIDVKRSGDDLVAIVLPYNNSNLSSMLAPYSHSLPFIVLGSFKGFRIQEAEYLQRMKRLILGDLLQAAPCVNPALKDFI